jgi:hypothetical protein
MPVGDLGSCALGVVLGFALRGCLAMVCSFNSLLSRRCELMASCAESQKTADLIAPLEKKRRCPLSQRALSGGIF